jgi:hypothetical protein
LQNARNQIVGCALGSLKGVEASGLARACEATHDTSTRPWSFTDGRTTKAKHRFRRDIAEKGEGHMKGVESIYTSGEIAIEAGSAG